MQSYLHLGFSIDLMSIYLLSYCYRTTTEPEPRALILIGQEDLQDSPDSTE